MEFSRITDLLARYRASLDRAHADRSAIAKIVSSESGLMIPESSLRCEKGVLTVKAMPGVRHAVFMARDRIIARIASELGVTIGEIR